jgi:hypothetical protein
VFLAPITPAQMIGLSFRFATMMTEAQMVIAMRMLGMAGLWRVTPTESARMITEKLAAAQESATAATRAALRGKSPAVVADHALKPIRRRTGANAKRLTSRGPGTP